MKQPKAVANVLSAESFIDPFGINDIGAYVEQPLAKQSVAQQIRDLAATGMTRGDIARKLNVRYQRVRNVLVPRVVNREVHEFEPAEDELLTA
jgi:hypothetical protein